MAEVVSPMERNKAMAYGFTESDIIYNGVIPDAYTKLQTAERGGIANFDKQLLDAEVGMSLLIEQPRHFFIVLNINTEAANCPNLICSTSVSFHHSRNMLMP
mgnify:CR=1 FL=1